MSLVEFNTVAVKTTYVTMTDPLLQKPNPQTKSDFGTPSSINPSGPKHDIMPSGMSYLNIYICVDTSVSNAEGGGPKRRSELKIQIEGVPAGRSHVDVLCFDLVYFTRPAQFVILSTGIFFFYLLYGYYQELIFSLPGFSGYGWYLTLIQFGYYSVFGKVG